MAHADTMYPVPVEDELRTTDCAQGSAAHAAAQIIELIDIANHQVDPLRRAASLDQAWAHLQDFQAAFDNQSPAAFVQLEDLFSQHADGFLISCVDHVHQLHFTRLCAAEFEGKEEMLSELAVAGLDQIRQQAGQVGGAFTQWHDRLFEHLDYWTNTQTPHHRADRFSVMWDAAQHTDGALPFGEHLHATSKELETQGDAFLISCVDEVHGELVRRIMHTDRREVQQSISLQAQDTLEFFQELESKLGRFKTWRTHLQDRLAYWETQKLMAFGEFEE